MNSRIALITAMSLALLACSGSSKTQKTRAETEPVAKAKPPASERLHPGPPRPWAEMSTVERKTYMASTVVPTMAPLFKAYDDAYFGDFGCQTCHGDHAISRGYAMPNPDIRALFPTGSQEQKDMVREDRDVLVFMFQTVVPNLRDLLGATNYDPDSKTGFSCHACHPKGIPKL